MKTIRTLLMVGITVASLGAPISAAAQASTPPPASATPPPAVVPGNGNGQSQNLNGVPAPIQQLVIGFDKTRDSYLATQDLLLIKLKNATTGEERDRIRAQLTDNRQAFLLQLQGFRGQLKDQLTALKGKISHEEFLRIIDAAHNAATEGGINHHKGQ